jgi:hypothetical protein
MDRWTNLAQPPIALLRLPFQLWENGNFSRQSDLSTTRADRGTLYNVDSGHLRRARDAREMIGDEP